jgi:transcription termination factor Rho
MRIRDRPFSVTEFERRVPANVLGVEVFVATAEDTVLAKLEGSKASRSDRQVQDVVDLLRVRGSDLDRAYLDHWARELGVADLLGAAFPTH